MHLNIENIGIVQSANINLDGLTVIAGLNDTGKSTIGKIIFSVIKSIQRYDDDLFCDNNDFRELMNVAFEVEEHINQDSERTKYIKELIPLLRERGSNKEIEKTIIFVQNTIDKVKLITPKKKELIERLNVLKSKLNQKKSINERIQQTLTKVLQNEFRGEINSKFNSKQGHIKLEKENKLICKVSIKNNKLVDFEFNDDKKITDVTYIETPISFNYFLAFNHRILKEATFGEQGKLAFHIIDLLSKLQEADSNNKTKLNVLDFLNDTTKTKVLKKQKKGIFEFNFSKLIGKKEFTFENINTAIGIKSFSFIELLYRANKLNEDNLLIIDEPEVHLHPKWQIEYAKLLVKLAESGLNILITTHSPYIIEAINKFKDKSKINEEISFYSTEKQNNHSVKFIDKTKQINDISRELSEPFETLLYD